MLTHRKAGLTMVELLVVLSIVGLLLAITLPAVQMARESARRAQCHSNLKQLGVAIQSHHTVYGYFPTGGWGHTWVGDPHRGFGEQQPGGWIYNTLPYLGQQPLRRIEPGASLVQGTLPVLHCPSRRSAGLYPYHGTARLRNVVTPVAAAKTDYAINGGDKFINTGRGPLSMAPADVRAYEWPNLSTFTGISFVRTRLSTAAVRDGASHTYLLGEKYLSTTYYHSSDTRGDDQTMYLGDDADIRRWTISPPIRDDAVTDDKSRFGSAHSSGCHFLLCDGSARLIAYDIDPILHRHLGNRKDRTAIDMSNF